MSAVIEHFKNRRDTAANWASKNPVLLDGEIGLETDTRKFKFGNGATSWNSLGYAGGDVIVLSAGAAYPSPAPPAGTLVLRLL